MSWGSVKTEFHACSLYWCEPHVWLWAWWKIVDGPRFIFWGKILSMSKKMIENVNICIFLKVNRVVGQTEVTTLCMASVWQNLIPIWQFYHLFGAKWKKTENEKIRKMIENLHICSGVNVSSWIHIACLYFEMRQYMW